MSIAGKVTKKGLAWLIALLVAVTFMPSIAFQSFAASASVTMKYVDKAGETKTIETWYYDEANKTYHVGSAEGETLSIVKDFTTKDAISQINPSLATYLDENGGYYQADESSSKVYGLPYTGINRKPDPRCLGVATKGIILDDMLEYLGEETGMSLKGETNMSIDGSSASMTYNAYWGKDRFYYPGWYNASSFTATAFTDEYKSGDTTEGASYNGTDLGKGYKVPTVMTILGYHATTASSISSLISTADDYNALRNFQGQVAGGAADDINMGANSWKGISSITFTPVYNKITVADGTAAEGKTEGEDGYAFTAGKATVTASDNYFKAAAGETVTLTVKPETGYDIKAITVTDANSKEVTVKEEADFDYSFTMPETAATVKVETKESDIDTAWYSKDGKSFEIGTKKELAGLAAIVNGTAKGIDQDDFAGKTVTLKNDITLDTSNDKYTAATGVFGTTTYAMEAEYYTVKEDASIWTPIGTGSSVSSNAPTKCNYFKGTFDGAGKTVSGLYTDGTASVQGLFGCLGEGAAVKNLTVEGCVTANIVAGGVAAYVNGATVENCTNKAIVYADGGQVAGSGEENGTYKSGAVGGIIGTAAGASTVKDCENTANITCTNTSKGGRTGGIIGLIDKSTDAVTISKCFNSGKIDAYQYTGGIVGMNASAQSPVTACGNTGDVTGHSPGKMYIGGIAGQMYSDISDSYNTGDFIGSIDGNGGNKVSQAGGIAGIFGGSKITNCYNTGSITTRGNAGTYSSTGGIAGSGYGTLTANKLIDCWVLEGTAYDNKGYVTEKSAVKITEEAISDIGEITVNSGDAIEKARKAYDALEKASKKQVENYAELTIAEEEYTAIKGAYDKIAAIDKDEIKLSDEKAVKAARAAYDALSKDEKKKIKNYSVLTEAEADIAKIRKENTPTPPAGVKAAAASYNTVKVSWSNNENASGYDVYRAASKTGTYKLIKETADSTYTDKSLTTGKVYYYVVKAYKTVDGVKVYGEASSKVSAKPVPATTTVKLAKGKKQATVKWSKVAGASGYRIYRSTSKTGTYERVKTITSSSTFKYVNKSLKSGKTYYYKVKAYRTVSGERVFGAASTAKSVKVK